jgi:hypothetical protein
MFISKAPPYIIIKSPSPPSHLLLNNPGNPITPALDLHLKHQQQRIIHSPDCDTLSDHIRTLKHINMRLPDIPEIRQILILRGVAAVVGVALDWHQQLVLGFHLAELVGVG